MSSRHLTDIELQDFLDRNFHSGQRALKIHLETCVTCQMKLTQYQLLAKQLQNDENLQLPVNFADRVLAQLQPAFQTKPAPKWLSMALISLALIVSFGVTAWFVGAQKISTGISQFFENFQGLYKILLTAFKGVVALTNISTTLIVLAGLVFGIIYLIDHFLVPAAFKFRSGNS